jgi:hypothetical protein
MNCSIEVDDLTTLGMHLNYDCSENLQAKVECKFCNDQFTKKDFIMHVRDCNELVNMVKESLANKSKVNAL